jgi:hypothetical protein
MSASFTYKGRKVEILRVRELKERKPSHFEKWTFSINGKVDWYSTPTASLARREAKRLIDSAARVDLTP